jgi:phosphoglucosamine mutase
VLSAAQDVPGAMISASHNPYTDNGVKFFARGGRKLSDDVEEQLEAELRRVLDGEVELSYAGAIRREPEAVEWYERQLLAALEGERLDGLHVVLDCANGSATSIAPAVFAAAGARVDVIGAEPTGTNINDGFGSTHPEALQQAVIERGADAGLAFDGDADRVLAVDATGQLVDGDQTIALCALDLRRRGRLSGDTVVVTVMTNLGFKLAMAAHDIQVVETAVGDRYVLEALDAGGWSLGGEQSGHVVFRDLATTGDGLLTGLMVLAAMKHSGRPLADLAAVMTRLPQVLRNVKVRSREALEGAEELWAEVARVEAELGDQGRVLLRPSGTEPLVRVMVEAPSQAQAEAATARLAAAVEKALA